MPYFQFDNHNIFYNETGSGYPLLLLHGNSVSSAMFRTEFRYFAKFYRVLTFDYPGHGKSDRLDSFRDDFWYYNALAALELLKNLGISKTKIIGTSGGAMVGLNIAAEKPDAIEKIIADSFFGLYLPLEEALNIKASRERGKKQILASAFWQAQHGADWKDVIDNDTDMLVRVAEKGMSPFVLPLSNIISPTLITASIQDELIPDIKSRLEYVSSKIKNSKCYFSDIGKHPLMITQKERFRAISLEFLGK